MKMQKCLHLRDALALKTPRLHGEFLISEKEDGWWVRIPFGNGQWYSPLSSANRVIPAFGWVATVLNSNTNATPHGSGFLIAEAVLPDTPFPIANGIFNRSKGDCHCKDVVFKVHDLVYEGSADIAIARYHALSKIDLSAMLANFQLHGLLATREYNRADWYRLFDSVLEKGGEGIVAKRSTGLYMVGKRNSDLLKLKLECTVDALAESLEEGIGDKGNPSLTLISRRKNGTKIRTVIAKHSDQALFRADPTSVLGKVVQLSGMEEFPDGQLRQPVFNWIREDKQPEDID